MNEEDWVDRIVRRYKERQNASPEEKAKDKAERIKRMKETEDKIKKTPVTTWWPPQY
jgi:hypothetical protein